MKPEDMTPAELDEAACEAVGIKLGFVQLMGSTERHFSARNEWVCDHLIAKDGGKKVPNYPPVSSEPAACAILEEALVDNGNALKVEQQPSLPVFAWVAGAPFMNDPWAGMTPSGAEKKERAVALAVVAWAQSSEGRP